MAYDPTAWVDGSVPAINAANLNKIELGIVSAFDQMSSISAGAGQSSVVVASASAPATVKAAADYVCDGVGDEVEINAALIKATRPNDGFGGGGQIRVLLAGPTFTIANPILMAPNTTLSGFGRGTLVQPPTTTGDYGAIQLLNANSHGVTVENLTVGRQAYRVYWDAIRLLGAATGSTYEVWTGADSYATIRGVTTLATYGRGIQVGGVAGANGNREAQIHDCTIWSAYGYGIHIWGASDSKIRNCVVAGGDSHGIVLGGGNSSAVGCKVFYRGNMSDGDFGSAGFWLSSSRTRAIGCEAQDCAGHGFYVTGTDTHLSGCMADSNSGRNASTYAGFHIEGSGTFTGLNATTRNQNVYEQNRGIVLSGSPQVALSGRVKVAAGSDHITGTPGSGSYIRVVRSGTSVYTEG